MRFSLRTLIVVMLLGGPLVAGIWWLTKNPVFVSPAVFVLCLVIMAMFTNRRSSDAPVED